MLRVFQRPSKTYNNWTTFLATFGARRVVKITFNIHTDRAADYATGVKLRTIFSRFQLHICAFLLYFQQFFYSKALPLRLKFWFCSVPFCFISPSFTQTAVEGALTPNKLNMRCNESSPGNTDCEIMKESPAAYTSSFHFPHTYVVFICVSLASALLVSSAFIVSYYYCSIRKRVEDDEDVPRGDDWTLVG